MAIGGYVRDKVRVERNGVRLFAGSEKAFEIWAKWHEVRATDQIIRYQTEWKNPWTNRSPHEQFEAQRV